MAKLFLFDTMLHIYRSFYAIPPLRSQSGIPTNAITGLVNLIQSLWRSEDITHMVCCLESREDDFRKTLDPRYRGQRPSRPGDLDVQLPWIEKLLRCLGITGLRLDPYEADDVMATLTKAAVRDGHEVVVVTNDKDMTQLCRYTQVRLLHIRGNGAKTSIKYLDGDDVRREYGIYPHQAAEWLALKGDQADNIPGVQGIGPKTAAQLLDKAGSLDALLADTSVAGRHAGALTESADRVRLNLKLTRLRSNIPYEFNIDNFAPKPFDGLVEICRDLSLNRLGRSLSGGLFVPTSLKELWA